MTEIRLTVYGRPRPQGSKRHVGHGIMIESSKGLKAWRQEVSLSAIALRAEMFPAHVPLELSADFYFAPPQTLKRCGMTTKPDLSKLVRAIEDALTGILFHDDSQIVRFTRISKHYGIPERVEISVRELETG